MTTKSQWRITADRTDNNGVRVSSNTAETLGEAYNRAYPSREEAQAELDELQSTAADLAMPDARYHLVEDTYKAMTEAEARAWVKEHNELDDLDEIDGEELEAAFAGLLGRPADNQDRAEGLYSHLCAAL